MPKKLGTNPKAEAARERKADKKREEKERHEKQIEDSKWEDNDRRNATKQQRKEGKEQKRLAELQRKQEARALLAEEEAKIKAKPAPASSSKVTRAQIAEEKQKQAQLERKRAKEQAKVEEDDIFTEENPNQKMAEMLAAEGASEARSVEEAIATLSVGKAASVDKHPEKRMKAAWTAFEAERLPVLKAENTNLRMSQLKQLLRKEWLKSPDNPLNQMR